MKILIIRRIKIDHYTNKVRFNDKIFFTRFQELAEIKERVRAETEASEAKKKATNGSKPEEKNASLEKSALEAAMAATLAEYAPPSLPISTPSKFLAFFMLAIRLANHKKTVKPNHLVDELDNIFPYVV